MLMAGKAQLNEFSVSEVTQCVKQLIEGEPALGGIWVRGEASNVRLHSSGHLYLTLKDGHSQLAAAYFRFGRKRKPPVDGDALLVHGDVRVYEPRGQYQLIADDILKAGTGDLAARFEALKRTLHEEGLFSAELKVPLPMVPERIAVITSLSTAALQDVLNVLKRRAPYLDVILIPASVQGDAAPAELVGALKAADAYPGVELILMIRGGGSMEDLWCFNDEQLARTLAGVKRPVITGVGHEIDFTIVDFIADQRAPTPSAAAELAAPDVAELRAAVADQAGKLATSVARELGRAGDELARVFDQRVLRDVLGTLDTQEQDLDSLAEQLADCAARATMLAGEDTLDGYLEALSDPLAGRLEDISHLLPRLEADLLRSGRHGLEQIKSQLDAKDRILGSLDPQVPKKLGFALVWREDGTLVRDEKLVEQDEQLRIEVKHGELKAKRL